MFKTKFIRAICAVLVCSVLILASLLGVAAYTGLFEDGNAQFSLFGFNFNLDWLIAPGLLEFLQNGGNDGDVELPEDDGGSSVSGGAGAPGGQLSDTGESEEVPVFSVYTPMSQTAYFKTQSFGDYVGRGWEAATPYDALLLGEYSADYLPMLTQQYNSIQSMQITPIQPVHVTPYYICDTSSHVQTNDTLSQGDTSSAYAVNYFVGGSKKTDIPADVASYELEYREFVHNNYLYIDDETKAFMDAIIALQGFDANNINIVNDVAYYIRHAAKYNLKYDKSMDNEKNSVIAFLGKYKEGVCRHYASSATLLFRALGIPARYTVGFMASIEGNTENIVKTPGHAWVEVYIDGVGWQYVEVTGSDGSSGGGSGGSGGSGGGGDEDKPQEPTQKLYKVTLKPVDQRKKGTEGTNLGPWDQLEGFDEFAAMGFRYSASMKGKQSDYGTSYSTITDITIFDSSNNDVTELFDITLKQGILQVYREEVTFTSRNISKVYDGRSISVTGGDCRMSGLPAGYSYEIASTDLGFTDVKKAPASFAAKIYDSAGKDVSDEFYIRYSYGQAEITPRSITLKAGSATKKYDGTPLTNPHEYEITGGSLAEGDIIESVRNEGSQTDVGRTDNTIKDVVIKNSDGKDVTKNYAITEEKGLLRVTPNL